jgi:anhydro-N-acetylmuramic acid kinase
MNILGIMSGTSLDGLDLAMCSFEEKKGFWSYKTLCAETIPYDEGWGKKLDSAPFLSGKDLHLLDIEYGNFIASQALSLMGDCGLAAELISSHGHTVFHQPQASLSCQIGNLQAIASGTGIAAVGDFRQKDVLYGGHGAPLVPVGDELLFGQYDYCLNLGGFANISYQEDGKRLARDLCPANIVLNHFARELNIPFDRDGKAGQSGNLSNELLQRLNGLTYYSTGGPGSLSREWLESEFLPVFHDFKLPITDILRTLYEHISQQVSDTVKPRSRVLVTGGGAYNTFLIQCLRTKCRAEIDVPDPELIEFKEAIVFAFLGLLRLKEKINCYASVTGADRDSCSGILYLP